jgi:flagellar protein FlgJ
MRVNFQQPITGQTAAAQAQNKDDAALKKACHEFESLMVNQMIKKMRDSVPKSDFFGSREEEETFQNMLDEETSKNISSSGGFGLGDLIYKQLTAQNTAKVSEKIVDK